MGTNYFEEFDKKFNKESEGDSVESVLLNISDQIKERYFAKGLDSTVTSSEGPDAKERVVALYLYSLIGSNYNYRLINVAQPIDREFPITVSAFLNPPSDPIVITDIKIFKEWIINKVIGDVRMRIVTDHLEKMGVNIKEWRDENEGNPAKLILLKQQLRMLNNHAGALRLTNGTEINYGSIEVRDDNFVFYTRKGLDEIFSYTADKVQSNKLKIETEENLIKSGHIASIAINTIDKILF